MHGRLFSGLIILTTAILLGCGGGNSSSAGDSGTRSHSGSSGQSRRISRRR